VDKRRFVTCSVVAPVCFRPPVAYSALMAFTAHLASFVLLTAATLLWAKWSKLDLGLRSPALKGVWSWVGLFVLWCAAEAAFAAVHPIQVDPEWLEEMQQFSLPEDVLLSVVLYPLWEELFFRGAMFSALIRRWGSGPRRSFRASFRASSIRNTNGGMPRPSAAPAWFWRSSGGRADRSTCRWACTRRSISASTSCRPHRLKAALHAPRAEWPQWVGRRRNGGLIQHLDRMEAEGTHTCVSPNVILRLEGCDLLAKPSDI